MSFMRKLQTSRFNIIKNGTFSPVLFKDFVYSLGAPISRNVF